METVISSGRVGLLGPSATLSLLSYNATISLPFMNSAFQMGVVYTCTRVTVNVSQSYFPFYLTDTLHFQKVSKTDCHSIL